MQCITFFVLFYSYLLILPSIVLGTIPKELSKLKKLEIIDLYANQLTGTIPSELATIPKLSEFQIDCSNNQDFFQLLLSLRNKHSSLTFSVAPILLYQQIQLKEYLDLHDNNLVGTMPQEICDKKLDALIADCHGRNPEVKCDCCTVCCAGLPLLACFDPKTGKQMTVSV